VGSRSARFANRASVVALKEFVPQSIQRYKFVTALKEILKEFGVTNL
jgi:hypothetical protein